MINFEKKRTYYSMRGRTLVRETREHLNIIKVISSLPVSSCAQDSVCEISVDWAVLPVSVASPTST